mmetsp:Transcript_12303/g.39355  ORF Transcript_12303/g.39355 Transcript_12303/m.39355 type:complete len:390 (+) Transcript_12303:2-1171(+)
MGSFFRHTLLGWGLLAVVSVPIYRKAIECGALWAGLAALAHLVAAVGWGGRKRSYMPPQSRTSADALASFKLADSVSTAATAKDAFLDLTARTLLNLIYEDEALWRYDQSKQMRLLRGFDLDSRINGVDAPAQAHTMIGIHRLRHLRDCVETVIREDVLGDLIETGVLRGGACVWMKAVLAANQCKSRRVFACDTFQPAPGPAPAWVRWTVFPVIRLLASIPFWRWQRALFLFMQHLPNPNASFPRMEDPSDDTVRCGLFLMQHLGSLPSGDSSRTTVDGVRTTFARYGLLDNSVRFVRGFFSDSLPPLVESGELKQLALIRLDGDTYESTMTALEPLYPLLSPGGFVIVDDYHSFEECRRAVDEYRSRHGIREPLQRVDALSVAWRKS